jgi:hypothetical protein
VDIDSYVYFGSSSGFTSSNRQSLPTHGASQCQVADLNADTLLDIAFTNYMTDESTATNSSIYWGQPSGLFDVAAVTQLPTQGATNAAIADFDNDGIDDLVFANYALGHQRNIDSYVYFGPDFTSRTDLPTTGANDVEVADLDHDGSLDVVFANYRGTSTGVQSIVYYGSPVGPTTDRSTSLQTQGGLDAEIADLDGDGWEDLVFANNENGGQYSIESKVFWSSLGEFDDADTTGILGQGARHVVTGDLDEDGACDVVVASEWDDLGGYDTTSPIYFSDAARGFGAQALDANAWTVSIVGRASGVKTADAW